MTISWVQQLLDGLNGVALWQAAAGYALFGLTQIALPPFPGDILLFFCGSVWPHGFAGGLPILAAYWTGTTLGSLGAYELGARGGTRIFAWRWLRRFFPEHAQHAVTRWLNASGTAALFAAKFITGMNLPMLILSGAMGCERRRCYSVIVFTTVVHNVLFYSAGALVGDHWPAVMGFMGRYRLAFALAVALVIAAALIVPRLLRRIVQRKTKD